MGSSLLQESDNISILRGYIITPGMAMILLDNILRIMSSEAFGKDKSAYIVGGEKKLISLIEAGKIDSDKPVNKQNGKWRCNAAQVLLHCKCSNKKSKRSKNLRDESIKNFSKCSFYCWHLGGNLVRGWHKCQL